LERDTKSFEKKYQAFYNKMKEKKNNELNRIGREFSINNYERRFNVSQEVILAALVGEEKAKPALQEQIKKQDDYKRIVEKNKTFTFSSLR